MLKIRGLTKNLCGNIQGLNGVDLDVSPGMFGLLGPNGAGKTTLMKILATLLEPDSGTAEMNGVDLIANKQSAREMLGYLPQEFGLYPTFTAEQTLDYFAKLKGVFVAKQRKSWWARCWKGSIFARPQAACRWLFGRHATASGNRSGDHRSTETANRR